MSTDKPDNRDSSQTELESADGKSGDESRNANERLADQVLADDDEGLLSTNLVNQPDDDDDILAGSLIDDADIPGATPSTRAINPADSNTGMVIREVIEPAHVQANPNTGEQAAEEPKQDPTKRSDAAQYRHDLRTPFNLMIGYSEMLIEDAEDDGDEYFGGHLQSILRDAKQLLNLIDEILNPANPTPSQERLNHDLLFPLSHLRQNVMRLRQQAADGGRDVMVPDLDRIQIAVEKFGELVGRGYLEKATAGKRDKQNKPHRPKPDRRPRTYKDTDRLRVESGTLLVVDDNESNRNMLSRRLIRQNHNVQVAENGRRALEMLRSQDFDLVLLDVMMPEMDGYEVLERMHRDDKLRGIPVIMISALDQLDTAVRCIELGAEDYLTKPFNPTILRARIGACLEKKRLRDRERAYIRKLRTEQERSEQLLLNILPKAIAGRLKEGHRTIADSFPDVSVLFADLVGFTRLSEQVAPADLVAMLNKIFSMFDLLAEKHGLEKIKTIGDEYMVAAGLPTPNPEHAEACANMALDMLAVMERFNAKRNQGVRIRVGMNCGPVTAGVIGTKKFAYDLWGDTVNIASRMESHGIANSVQVTEATYKRLRSKFSFQRRGIIHVKGKGALCTYFLVGRRTQK